MDSKLRSRFERSVDRSGDHHLRTGASDAARGTGKVKVGGRTTTAHRVAWMLEHEALAPGVRVLPCEDEPARVRIDHCDLIKQRRVHRLITARNATQATNEVAGFVGEVRAAPVVAASDESRTDFRRRDRPVPG